MKNFIIVLTLMSVIGLAVWYVYKAKKSGKKCIGCPESDSCPGRNGTGSYCCDHDSRKN